LDRFRLPNHYMQTLIVYKGSKYLKVKLVLLRPVAFLFRLYSGLPITFKLSSRSNQPITSHATACRNGLALASSLDNSWDSFVRVRRGPGERTQFPLLLRFYYKGSPELPEEEASLAPSSAGFSFFSSFL